MLGSAHWLARSMPRGCNGSPPDRGAGVYADRSGHVSAPDPRLGHVQGPSMLCPETFGPHCGRPGPHTGGSRSHSRGLSCTRGGPGPTLEVRRCCGPRVVARGWDESWLSPTHSTFNTRLRDSRVDIASLYSSKGYPSFRVPTVAPGPTSGEDASLQVGPKLVLCFDMA
jgi:hypothetical protein